MNTTLTKVALAPVMERLAAANGRWSARFPGEGGARQPVHVVYGGAHRFRADTVPRLGKLALEALGAWGADAMTLARAIFPVPPARALATTVFDRVKDKLVKEPVEDFRIDFEDGFGVRPDPEEDATAVAAAREVAAGLQAGTLSPFIGIRIKTLNDEWHVRAVRTFDLFTTALLEATGGRLPPGFVITLPKVVIPDQVAAFADVVELFEVRTQLPPGALQLEIMVETPQAVIASEGHVPLRAMVDAGRGRVIGAHFGTYDYTAGCGITAAHQQMGHPACGFAKSVMQVALAGTGVFLSDGATSILPVPIHRAAPDRALADTELDENRDAVHRAWRLHAADVRRSLETGFYQGWDLHPAQLVSRFATVFAFYLEALSAATERLRNFLDKAAQATLVGDVFDDAATGQALLNFFLRGLASGALTDTEVLAAGLTRDELATRSFPKILAARATRGGASSTTR